MNISLPIRLIAPIVSPLSSLPSCASLRVSSVVCGYPKKFFELGNFILTINLYYNDNQ